MHRCTVLLATLVTTLAFLAPARAQEGEGLLPIGRSYQDISRAVSAESSKTELAESICPQLEGLTGAEYRSALRACVKKVKAKTTGARKTAATKERSGTIHY